MGINQFIQNYASVSLADGFWNCIEHSIRNDDPDHRDLIIRVLGVVHDSSQNYFPTTRLFDMYDYYTKHMKDYLYSLHKILYDFDLEIGVNYFDICHFKSLDEKTVSIIGTYDATSQLLDKLVVDGLQFRIKEAVNLTGDEPEDLHFEGNKVIDDNFKPKYPESILKYFVKNNFYAKFQEDKSEYKFILEKV